MIINEVAHSHTRGMSLPSTFKQTCSHITDSTIQTKFSAVIIERDGRIKWV